MKNNRRNRINPKYIFILLIFICVLGIGLNFIKGFSVSVGQTAVNTAISPMQSGINSLGITISNILKRKHTIAALEEENALLNEEISVLKSQLTTMQNNMNEYEELLEELELSAKYPGYEMTAARVISKDPGNWYSTFVINKGSVHGIQKDMNVIADNGLVGIVSQVNPTSSVVRSIIDDSSNVSAMISKNRDICIVNGDLKEIDNGLLTVELISKESTIANGDEVVTSYISDKFLPGILIGYVSEIDIDDSEMTYNAKLTPIVDFQHLSTVLVIKQLKNEILDTEMSTENVQGE